MINQKQALISIVMPNYNKGQFLAETIESIQGQSYPNWELLIVDDGSTDQSEKVAAKYVETDSRIKWLQRTGEKRGGSVCRNLGWKNSTGSFVLFFDSDDLMIPGCLDHRLQATQENDAHFYVFHMGIFKHQIGDTNEPWLVHQADHLRLFLQHKLSWGVMSVLWKNSTLETLDGFDEDFPRLQDVELSTRALLLPAVRYHVVDDEVVDCYYRVGERHSIDENDFMTNWTNGAILYVDKMSLQVESTDLFLLKGTIMATLQAMIHRYRTGVISKETYQKLWLAVLNGSGANKVLSKWNRGWLKLYRFGADRGCTKVKGFNFLMTQLIVRT